MTPYLAYTEAEASDPPMLRIEHGDRQNTITSTKLDSLLDLFIDEEMLLISFRHSTVKLAGTSLDRLFTLLEQKKIRSLHGFNPKRHAPPAAGEPVITEVEYRYN
jgi:hypothetical protein